LLLKDIFDAKYGMFVYDPKTHYYWFDSRSQDFLYFELIGKLLGKIKKQQNNKTKQKTKPITKQNKTY